jgi:hypothetical protein
MKAQLHLPATLLVIFFLLAMAAKSQTINGVPLDSIHTQYLKIVGTPLNGSNVISLDIDYGQYDKKGVPDTQLKGVDGKPVLFNSITGALNYMYERGYEYLQCYPVGEPDGSVKFHYMMQMKP